MSKSRAEIAQALRKALAFHREHVTPVALEDAIEDAIEDLDASGDETPLTRTAAVGATRKRPNFYATEE